METVSRLGSYVGAPWGWAGAVTLSEGRWAVSSGLEVELVGHGLVERELRRRLGLGGVELGRLVEEQVGLRRDEVRDSERRESGPLITSALFALGLPVVLL